MREVDLNPVDVPREGFPTLEELFRTYDAAFFESSLSAEYRIEWSKRLTRCAGYCMPGLRVIRISAPLHQYRSLANLKETVLHEMIHAYQHLHGAGTQEGPHGKTFRAFAATISRLTGLHIATHHSFVREVEALRQRPRPAPAAQSDTTKIVEKRKAAQLEWLLSFEALSSSAPARVEESVSLVAALRAKGLLS